ncbi:MAG TPA: sigma-70 family RNA polymerase sigma factor [Puia sp.]
MISKTKTQIVGGYNRKEDDSIVWAYDKYHHMLLNMAIKLTNNSANSIDYVAEGYLKLMENRKHLKNINEIRSFLINTIRNKISNDLKHKEWEEMQSAEMKMEHEIIDEEFETSHSMAVFEQLVAGSIEQLKPKHREIFKMHYYDRLTNAEIASKKNIPEQTVANVKTIVHKKLSLQGEKSKNYLIRKLFNLFI